VELIRVARSDCQLVAPADQARLYQRLLRDIAAGRLPPRAPRTNPRVVKRKMSQFARKRERPAPPSPHLVAFQTTIQVLPPAAPDHHILDQAAPLDCLANTVRTTPCPILTFWT